MAVKIRLSRCGRKNAPMYRLVAIDSRSPRDGEFLENLGTYNPKTGKIIEFHKERAEYWLSVGAVLTDTARKVCRLGNKHHADVASAATL